MAVSYEVNNCVWRFGISPITNEEASETRRKEISFWKKRNQDMLNIVKSEKKLVNINDMYILVSNYPYLEDTVEGKIMVQHSPIIDFCLKEDLHTVEDEMGEAMYKVLSRKYGNKIQDENDCGEEAWNPFEEKLWMKV